MKYNAKVHITSQTAKLFAFQELKSVENMHKRVFKMYKYKKSE